jgi:hypothetical protein
MLKINTQELLTVSPHLLADKRVFVFFSFFYPVGGGGGGDRSQYFLCPFRRDFPFFAYNAEDQFAHGL